jgi:hypothetical protein
VKRSIHGVKRCHLLLAYMEIAHQIGLIWTEMFDQSYTTASNVILVAFSLIIVTIDFRSPPTILNATHKILYW